MAQGNKDYEWLVNFELGSASLTDRKWCRDELSLVTDRSSENIGQRLVYGAIAVATQSASKRAATKEAVERIEEFLDILALGCPMVGFFSGFPRIQNTSAVCTNEREIIQAGQLPPADNGIRLHLSLYFESQSLAKGWNMWRKLDVLPNATLLRQLTRFYRIGRAEDDAYLKLFNLWISFNALYRDLRQVGSDVDKIRYFVTHTTQNDPNKTAKVIDLFRNPTKYVHDITPLTLCLLELNSADLFDALIKAGLGHSQALSNQMASLSQGVLEESLLCVYDIRNDYFHGHMTPTDVDSRRSLVYLCCIFLDYMLQWGLNCWLHDEATRVGLTL